LAVEKGRAMSETGRVGDLDVDQDLELQRHMWAVQRVGWVVMAAAVLAAVLGLFGGAGPLSKTSVGDPDAPLSIEEYERFSRFGMPTTLRVHLDPARESGGEVRLSVSREYLESVQIQSVTPQPRSVAAGPDWLTYVFDVTSGPGQPTAVTFNLQPDRVGLLEGRVRLEGPRGELEFGQFVYP
jgi:hypothetical protein